MPNLDQTGPQGQGPRTGRGIGRCNQGYGARCEYCGCKPYARSEEKEILEEDIQNLETSLKIAKERLAKATEQEGRPR